LPEREIATGIGLVRVRQPRVRDRGLQREERIRFSPSILPPYARRSKSLDVLIPLLHLKGISTGDFAEALPALVGSDAGNLSTPTIARLKEVWTGEHARWLERDLSAKHYVYLWVDGWKTKRNASSSSSERHRTEKRNWSAWPMASVRAPYPGRNCCSI
jgi:transposase-like protein